MANKKLKNINNIVADEFHIETKKYMDETEISYRKALGQYFTPRSIRETLIKMIPKDVNTPKVLDPACGTGEFLLSAKNYFKEPILFGWDIDKRVLEIARKIVPDAELSEKDSLLDEEYNQFDIVIGNPPYYEFRPTKIIRKKFGRIINGRVNIFSLFIYQGLNWLKDEGYLAYVVPSSMLNGAYFLNLRRYIVEKSNIEYLRVLDDTRLFQDALQSTTLLVLKKGKNKGDYIFEKNGILIFSENADFLKRLFERRTTLYELGFKVKTGRLVWNQNKGLLTNNPQDGIPLIWAHNIGIGNLNFPILNKGRKPQYVKTNIYDQGPAIVVNRITGTVKSSRLKAAIIPIGMKFIAENHVNVIFPPENEPQQKFDFEFKKSKNIILEEIVKQLISEKNFKILRSITGNTQISKNELEKLFPIDINF
jgi:adenine-specific DNA-methyltransferase